MASPSKSASASASTSTADDNTYYAFNVFLNYGGPDGKPFAISLYNRFKGHAHLRVFLEGELQMGEEITRQIEGAIRASSVNIALFSPSYCESDWCLKELELMLECNRTKRSTILPIFFHVKRSVVKWMQDKYGEALSSRQNKRNRDGQLRYKPEIIEKWKEALHDVAKMDGYELDEEPYNGDESKLLDDVVEKVLKLVPKPPLNVSKYPTGLEEIVKDFNERLQQHESGKAKVVGIVGLGGIGKTTLAKEFYNREKKEYRRSSFVFDVRENNSRQQLKNLQKQLIKELSGKDTEINSTAQGIPLLEKHLPHWHALIILDDVDDIEQLRALLPVLPAKDSLILVTSRDESVLQNWELIEDPFIYTLEGLSLQHSVELFCWHAFRQPAPPDAAFEQLVNKFVDACGKLPLSLSVIGALLRGKKPKNWKKQLRKIRKTLPTQIQKILEISYESLDDEEKKLFLDVACFFAGEEKDTAMMTWENSGWAASLGLESLRNKHLVEVEVDAVWKDIRVEYFSGRFHKHYRECMVECIRMHDDLRDMGRYLADKEPSLRRIWRVTENLSDLSPVAGNSDGRGQRRTWATMDSNGAQSAVNGDRKPRSGKSKPAGSYRTTLQRKAVSVQRAPMQLGADNCPSSDAGLTSACHIRRKVTCCQLTPSDMRPINCEDCPPFDLQVEGIRDSAERDRRVQEVRWRAPNCQGEPCIPGSGSSVEGVFNFEQPPQLILLRCYNCPDSSLPPNISTKNLGVLHIEGSNLETLWHLESQAPRELRELYIAGSRLPKIPQSIGQLRRLEKVVLRSDKDIVSFKTLPDEFCQLHSLKHLELHEKGLKSLPESFGDLSSLQHLNLAWSTCLEELPDSCRNLTKLQHIDLSSCMELLLLPEYFGNLTNLEHIDLSDCKNLKILPNTFGNLIQLKFLSLRACPLTKLSEALGNIATLELLNLAWCSAELPPQLTSQLFLQELHLTSSKLPEAIGNLSNLKILSVESRDLEMLPASFGALRSLEELDFRMCPFTSFPGSIRMLTQLKKLALTYMDLRRLNITEWLSGLPTTLETLEINGCEAMEELSGLERLESLEHLEIASSHGLKRIHGLAQLTKLQTLDVSMNDDLEELPGVDGSQSLKEVHALSCPKLKREYESSHRTCKYFFK